MFNLNRNLGLTILLSSYLTVCGAANKVDGSLKAYPPYRIKPNSPLFQPSGYSPAQILNGYRIASIALQGKGQIIGIVDAYDNPNAEADLSTFSTTFNLPACTTANGCFQKIYAAGTKPPADTGWGTEIALDVEWAHAIAPAAKIMLVEAADNSFDSLFTAINVAIQKGATVISMSWGGDEFSSQTQYDSVFNVPNVTFTAASGDSGHGTIYPSTSPYVVAVGGTTLNLSKNGTWVSETAWNGSGGGLSVYETIPSYQSSFPIPNANGMRGVPDVSWVGNPNTGVSVYDSFGSGGWIVVGGTSVGAPSWAALIAVARSGLQSPSGRMMLYNFAKQNYATVYHDITSGNNGTCGYYCNTLVGYDYVTGLGSPIGNNFILSMNDPSNN